MEQVEKDYRAGIRRIEALGLSDIGNLAMWSVSSHKIGFGVDALRADDASKLWQSDGPQPHYVDIHFSKRVSVMRISLFFCFALDESYTPSKIRILSGDGYHTLLEVTTVEFAEPSGWSHITFDTARLDSAMKSFLIRVEVLANHQNGKDTRIRSIKVFSPTKQSIAQENQEIGFTSVALLSESVIR